jgi:tetratricopeptide (TPR) repeat protein
MVNQIMVPMIELAARGEVDKALKLLRRTLKLAPMWGAARLNRQEMAALRALVREIGKAGAEYRKAVSVLPPDLQEVLPRIAVRKLRQDQQIVEGWLPGNLRDVPEFHSMLKAMTEGTSSDTYVEKLSETVRELSERLDGLAPEDLQNIGFLMAQLSTTQEARQANQNLYDLLGERLGETADGRVDYKAAEKLPGSSQAPATWSGYFFKMAAFGTAFNMVLGWLTKGVPIGGEWYDWGRFLSDPIRAGPAAWYNAKYLMLLKKIKELKEIYPYPRAPDKESKLQELEAERKKLNGKLDNLGLYFGLPAYSLSGIYYTLEEIAPMAALLYAQALASGAWTIIQQATHKKIARKLGIVPDLVEKLEIHPKGKAAVRWSAISVGVIAGTSVLVYEDYLSDDDDKAKRPSPLDYVVEGFNALMDELDGGPYPPAGPLDEPIVLPSLVAVEPPATSDPGPRAIDEAGNVWVPTRRLGFRQFCLSASERRPRRKRPRQSRTRPARLYFGEGRRWRQHSPDCPQPFG